MNENAKTVSCFKNCKNARTFKSQQYCRAIAFNKQRSLIVTSDGADIKIWEFNKGKLIWKLRRHRGLTQCLIFSKLQTQLVSSIFNILIIWKKERNVWICTCSSLVHADYIRCIILNKNEDQLISCSFDQTIIVWKVNCQRIQYYYKLENRHRSEIIALSLNENETFLLSCSPDGTIILWTNINGKWEYANQIKGEYGNKICFINNFQFLYQPCEQNYSQIFQIDNTQLIEKPDLRIHLQKDKNHSDTYNFQTIYNQKRKIIIHKHYQYIYLFEIREENFKIVQKPIKCVSQFSIGKITDEGQHLVMWDEDTQQFIIYLIQY